MNINTKERRLSVIEPIACCAPLSASSLTDAEAEATAAIFNALATAGGEVCGCELTGSLDLAQPTVSHHLKKLHDAGLLDREQRGKWAYYSLNRAAMTKLTAVADLKGACC